MSNEVVIGDRRKRLEAIKDRLAAVRGHAARAVWEYGALLDEVERESLWREDSVESFSDWLEQALDTNRASARKAILVARHFSGDMAERYGSEKLAATVRYLEATGKDEEPGDVTGLEFRVRDTASGHWASVPFRKATYRQIDEATALVRASARGHDAAPAPEADLQRKAKALTKHLSAAPKGTVRGDRVALKRGKDGRVAVTFQGIPVEELEQFVQAVRQHLLDG